MQYTVIQKIHTFTYIHKNESSTVKWAQWDKTQSRELLGLFTCVCSSLCTIVVHSIAQNRPDSFPPYPPDNHHCSNDVYLRQASEAQCKVSSVIQLPSAPIEAGRIINTHFSIYSGTDRVRLNYFSKNRINRVLELELEHTDNDCRMF